MITKIACRTIGAAGMGLAVYDAFQVGKQYSRNVAQQEESRFLEKAYFSSRTTNTTSFVSNGMRKKTFELRAKNPLPELWGRVKGATQGALESLGNNIFTVACSALALASKGLLAKIGAIGVLLGLVYDLASNGFGLGKQNPMN